MNPWLEECWQDIHAKLLVYACDSLNAELPSGLQARVDERLAIDAELKGDCRNAQALPMQIQDHHDFPKLDHRLAPSRLRGQHR